MATGSLMDIASRSFRDNLNCPICLDTLRSPKSLSCIHTFCEECIQSIIDNGSTSERQRSIVCPECRQKTAPPKNVAQGEWAKHLPTNWPLMRLMERLERIPEDVSNDLAETDNEVDGQLTVSPQDLEDCKQIEICQIHPGEKMSFFCRDHSAILCEECKNTVNRWGCNVVTITSQATDEVIIEKNSYIEKHFQDINNKLDETTEAMVCNITDVRDTISNFQSHMIRVRGELDQLLNEMQRTVSSAKLCDENTKRYSQCQESKITECQCWKEAMNFSKSEMETIMKYGTPEQRFIASEQLQKLVPMFEKAADESFKSATRVEVRHVGIEILQSILRMTEHMLNVEGIHMKLEK